MVKMHQVLILSIMAFSLNAEKDKTSFEQANAEFSAAQDRVSQLKHEIERLDNRVNEIQAKSNGCGQKEEYSDEIVRLNSELSNIVEARKKLTEDLAKAESTLNDAISKYGKAGFSISYDGQKFTLGKKGEPSVVLNGKPADKSGKTIVVAN